MRTPRRLPILIALFAIAIAVVDPASAQDAGFRPVLDKARQLDKWSWRDNRDDAWFEQEIPFFESPDPEVDAVYYYRWELLTKHMVYMGPQLGYVLTEFLNVRPISCAMGLHLNEARWLKDRRIAQDYARYWYTAPDAAPRSYSNWYAAAVWQNYLVTADRGFLLDRLPSMEAQYAGWLKERWDPEHRMFHWSGMHDGMEFTIGSRQTQDDFAGGDSYRPTLNSYVYGDLLATANAEEVAGKMDAAADDRAKAADLRRRVQAELWDAKRQFFFGQFVHDEQKDGVTIKAKSLIYQDGKYAGDPHGRELSGYTPWMFNLPEKGKGYEAAWKGVSDSNVFLAKYGLSFTERHDPLFLITKGGGCFWSGNNWPYADSQTLLALANVLDNYRQNVVTKQDYFKVFKAYTQCHLAGAVPYIAEDSNPDTGYWINNGVNGSEHYFHSSYDDLVITGLVGLHPRADNTVEVQPLAPDSWDYFCLDDVLYHQCRLSIVWDKTGSRYGRGKGLSIFADGRMIANRPELGKLEGELSPRTSPPPPAADRPINFAVSSEHGIYPWLTASYTAANTSAGTLADGSFYYHQDRPLNRWTTEGSSNATQWVQLDFGVKRPLDCVKLYLLDDGPTASVRAPAELALQAWNGAAWRSISGASISPNKPEGHRPATFKFPTPLLTSALRVLMTPQPGACVGMTEFEAWGHATLPLEQPAPPEGDLGLQAKASASFTNASDRVDAINDGKIDMRGGDRWTDYSSPNATDWVQLDFPRRATVGRLILCPWADGGGVRVPRSFSIQYWNDSNWSAVREISRAPAAPSGDVPNVVTIQPVQTSKIRVTLVPDLKGKSGVSELLVFEK